MLKSLKKVEILKRNNSPVLSYSRKLDSKKFLTRQGILRLEVSMNKKPIEITIIMLDLAEIKLLVDFHAVLTEERFGTVSYKLKQFFTMKILRHIKEN